MNRQTQSEGKSYLAKDILRQAYDTAGPNIFFAFNPAQCPVCACEFVQKLPHKRYICEGCGRIFQEREHVAA